MRRRKLILNLILCILIVLLSFSLFHNIRTYRREEAVQTQALKEISNQAAADKTTTAAPQKTIQDAPQESEPTEAPDSEAAAPAEDPAGPTPDEPDPAAAIQISCRGESWAPDGNDKAVGWPAKLQAILLQNGVNAQVSDNTLDMDNTLSQMRYAGVSEDTINNYISNHRAKGLDNKSNEVTLREGLDSMITERVDYDAIPILCIGYNGGYGVSKAELVEQEIHILKTYHLGGNETISDAEADTADTAVTYNYGPVELDGKYLILGHLSNGYSNAEALDKTMEAAWGDHYLSLSSIEGDFFSEEYRAEIARLVYEKLVALNYLNQTAAEAAIS